MLINDIFILETLVLIILFFYIITVNLTTLLYISGLYLIIIGFICFINDMDIYIGFLWVIDLGVGLIFFIFILHFTSFLYQKSNFNLTLRYYIILYLFILFLIIYYYYFSIPIYSYLYYDLNKIWFFKVIYIDYYKIFYSNEITDLNILKDTYFLLNTFEFFLVNFSLLYGLISAILFYFLIQRIFNFLNFSQIKNINIFNYLNTNFFIKNQNFITQQNTQPVIKIWSKKSN